MAEEPKRLSTGEIVLYAGMVGVTAWVTTMITMWTMRRLTES